METIFGSSLHGGECNLITCRDMEECEITLATVNLDSISFSPGVKKVIFRDCTITGLKTLLLDTSRQNISDLSLGGCKFDDIIEFNDLVTPLMTRITLSNVQFSIPTTLHTTTLKYIRLKSDRFDPPKSFDFLRSNKSIRELILQYPHHHLEESLDFLQDTNITHLTLCFKTIQSLEFMRCNNTITSLEVSESSLPSLDPLEGNDTLLFLDISFCEGVTKLPNLHKIEDIRSSFSDLRDLSTLHGRTHLLTFVQKVDVVDSIHQKQADAIQLQTQFNRLNSHLRTTLRKLCRLHLSNLDYPSTIEHPTTYSIITSVNFWG
jgi:hypothetical protein